MAAFELNAPKEMYKKLRVYHCSLILNRGECLTYTDWNNAFLIK